MPATPRALLISLVLITTQSPGADLTVVLGPDAPKDLTVGVLNRFDADGLLRIPVDPKAKLEAPRLDAVAQPRGDGTWRLADLPPGRYDLVLIAPTARIRVEGFQYPPITEFDPTWPGTSPNPDAESRDLIVKDIAASRHYENKIAPLFLATDARGEQVRILMQLVRDLPTSFDADFGAPVATVRHEIWQYESRYGTWSKVRKTVVLDRVLLARSDFHRWTWLWDPALGGITVGADPLTLHYAWPPSACARGWRPSTP